MWQPLVVLRVLCILEKYLGKLFFHEEFEEFIFSIFIFYIFSNLYFLNLKQVL